MALDYVYFIVRDPIGRDVSVQTKWRFWLCPSMPIWPFSGGEKLLLTSCPLMLNIKNIKNFIIMIMIIFI